MIKINKKLAALILTVALAVTFMMIFGTRTVYADMTFDFGNTGGCSWRFYRDDSGDEWRYILEITADSNGMMDDYTYSSEYGSTAPWMKYWEDIEEIHFDKVTKIGSYSFYELPKVSDISIQGVQRIGSHAFYNCDCLTRIIISGDHCDIGAEAFADCNGQVINEIYLDGVETIGTNAFKYINCPDLRLGNGLKTIGEGAFEVNNLLSFVSIPRSCTSIGEGAFWECYKLRGALILNPSCTIGMYAFDHNYSPWIYGLKDSTAKDYANLFNLPFRPVGDIGNGTLDLSESQIDLNVDDAYGNDNIIENTIEAIIADGKVAAKVEKDYNTLMSIDLDSDGSYDFILEEMIDTPIHPITVLPGRSVGGTITFELSQTEIEACEEKGRSVYGMLTIKLPVLSVSEASVTGISDKTYTGKAITQSPVVKIGNKTLTADTDYLVDYENNTNAGTATVTITGKGDYTGTVTKTFKIKKASNPLTIKPKTAAVKYSKLKKKNQTLAVSKVIDFKKDAKDKKTYTLSSAKKGKTSFKKYFTIHKNTGKLTVKKGLKKGTYKVTVKVKAAGNSNYKASASKTVTFTVKVN